MEEVLNLFTEILENEKFIYGVFSNLRKKDINSFKKVNVKPVLIKDELKYQFTYEYPTKVLHKNLNQLETIDEVTKLLSETFKQGMVFTKDADYQILISKKGKVAILKKKATKTHVDLSHNRKKQYILKRENL